MVPDIGSSRNRRKRSARCSWSFSCHCEGRSDEAVSIELGLRQGGRHPPTPLPMAQQREDIGSCVPSFAAAHFLPAPPLLHCRCPPSHKTSRSASACSPSSPAP